ncbi:MAG: cytochrome c biogenesis protein CcsA [Pirellulaceae bacterium]|nr:cytochrome c biogenesis protein CcsA [Pirellulaceae bacterium]
MSATSLPTPKSLLADADEATKPFVIAPGIDHVMHFLASLKLTVVLLSLAMFVVFVGTLAQTEADIWQVVRDYFHAWVMWVDVNILFPKSFFPWMPTIPLPKLPAPGGMTVGVLMAINLLAAHTWRFRVQASGLRLIGGLLIIGLGISVATIVILSGHNSQGLQGKPPFSFRTLWALFEVVLGGAFLASLVAFVRWGVWPAIEHRRLTWTRAVILGLAALTLLSVGILLIYTVATGLYVGDEGMRVLWQLVQGTLAGLILLVGCVLVFRKRGGMVLLHAGIGLLMFNEIWVAMHAVEWQVTLEEGQSTNFLRDIRTTELAIIDPSNAKTDQHTVIPRSLLTENLAANAKLANKKKPPVPIADPQNLLPFNVRTVLYYANADIAPLKEGDEPQGTKGLALSEKLVEIPAAKGTDTGGAVDMAGIAIQLSDKKTGADLGTYVLSQLSSESKTPEKFAERVTVGDKTYDLYLRFKREYKPYSIALVDVRKDDYVASDTPRNYSSDIRLTDEAAGVDQPIHIKMNDPLRYRGDTMYQSGYHPLPGGGEATTLQVVRNRGWMIPYVACAIVGIGMLAHFLITITRFIGRRENEEQAGGGIVAAEIVEEAPKPTVPPRGRKKRAAEPAPSRAPGGLDWESLSLSLFVMGLFLSTLLVYSRPPRPKAGEFNLLAFGELPVAHQGRVKPFDTLARNSLQAISNRQYVKLDKGLKVGNRTLEEAQKLTATQWLLDMMTRPGEALDYRVIRIDHPETIKLFELAARPGNYRYSFSELAPQLERFEKQVAAAQKERSENRTLDQNKLLETEERLRLFITLVRSFDLPRMPEIPSEAEIKADATAGQRYMNDLRLAVARSSQELQQMKAPRPIAVALAENPTPEEHWVPYPTAWSVAFVETNLMGKDPSELTTAFDDLLRAYRSKDTKVFNDKIEQYQRLLAKANPPLWSEGRTHFEAYFNLFSPFTLGMICYFLAFIIALAGWIVHCIGALQAKGGGFRSQPLQWTAFSLILLTFLLHTFALVARIYISGRPPVTNLYSSAIFIGWAAVLFGLIVELIFRIGIGNVVASVAGFATLIIAGLLASGGEDTVGVMQAVLDTQFWLATHVVCITLGYAATYVAGIIGVLYVLFGLCSPILNPTVRKILGYIIYGVVCFAIFFSFIGTVLGGLWADDSWGRFWGWDPKENGALLIVFWNALVLHARWDKMIADRGLAVLAIGGNIVTSWSWFGVNQLGIGLHSYGFTNGVVMALLVFGASQLLIIALGCLPKSLWMSYAADHRGGLMPAS